MRVLITFQDNQEKLELSEEFESEYKNFDSRYNYIEGDSKYGTMYGPLIA